MTVGHYCYRIVEKGGASLDKALDMLTLVNQLVESHGDIGVVGDFYMNLEKFGDRGTKISLVHGPASLFYVYKPELGGTSHEWMLCRQKYGRVIPIRPAMSRQLGTLRDIESALGSDAFIFHVQRLGR